MKKIFTMMAAALMVASGANAAITAKCNGADLKDGEVINVGKTDFGTSMFHDFEYIRHIDYSTTAAPVTLVVTSDHDAVQFCVAPNCHFVTEKDGVYTTDLSTDKGAFTADLDIYLDNDADHAVVPAVKKYVNIVATDATGATFTLKYDVNTEESGVAGVTADAVKLQAAGGQVLANGSAAGVEVYTLQGARVANEGLHGVYVVRGAGRTAKINVR